MTIMLSGDAVNASRTLSLRLGHEIRDEAGDALVMDPS
jgi:hypothetical protein